MTTSRRIPRRPAFFAAFLLLAALPGESLAQGQTARSVKPTLVQLGVDPGAVISGSAKTSFLQVLAGSGSRAKYEWLVKGKPGQTVELLVQSEKGGSAAARVTLK